MRGGYQVRLLTDTGDKLVSADQDPSSVGSDFEGLLLDSLAVLASSSNDSCRDAATTLRRGGGDGLLIAVLGSIDPEEARLFAQLRHGSTVAVAVLLDTSTWMSGRGREPRHDYDGSAALLRASGWRVVQARAGDSIAGLWPEAGRRQHDSELVQVETVGKR
jgi:hypothetical protein